MNEVKKKAVFILFFTFIPLILLAREKRDPHAYWKTYGRNKFGVSWGLAPAGPFKSNNAPYYKKDSDIGAFTGCYTYQVSRAIAVGISYSYTSGDGSSFFKAEAGDHTMLWEDRNHSVMPIMTVNWMKKRWGSIYSRVGIGVRIKSQKQTFDDGRPLRRTTNSYFASQVSPIGVEVGRKLVGFAEGGIGVWGSFLVGARYRFGK